MQFENVKIRCHPKGAVPVRTAVCNQNVQMMIEYAKAFLRIGFDIFSVVNEKHI